MSEFVFSTKTGMPQTYRNAHRQQLKLIGAKVGAPSVRFRLLRHQWATDYLRSAEALHSWDGDSGIPASKRCFYMSTWVRRT